MSGFNASAIALVAFIGVAGLGWFLLHAIRLGFDYMSARGNPRNRAQAHESARDLILGAFIVAACMGGIAVAVFNLIKVGGSTISPAGP